MNHRLLVARHVVPQVRRARRALETISERTGGMAFFPPTVDEVDQISRTIARQLGLNEDLTEAIALAHDLGHPPFGHAGEMALNECMNEHGGFEHNQHGLRIVELLEYRYADFPGLNLSWEVL